MNALTLAAALSVSRLMPVRFNGGIPANDQRPDWCAGSCHTCGISAWHPEAYSCTAPDCELRHAHEEPRREPG